MYTLALLVVIVCTITLGGLYYVLEVEAIPGVPIIVFPVFLFSIAAGILIVAASLAGGAPPSWGKGSPGARVCHDKVPAVAWHVP